MPKRLSGYLTKSKTYALSQEDFQAIVAKPCHYCGKETIPGKHYNGLDRVVTQVWKTKEVWVTEKRGR